MSEIPRLLAERAEDVCRYLLPNGVRKGREWKAGSVHGEAGESLGVVLSGDKVGVWSDFASGESGDLIGLWRACRNLEAADAFREAEAWLGIEPRKANGHARTPARPVAPTAEPSHTHPRYGAPTRTWAYRDANGGILGYINRFDRAGERKEVLPQTWTPESGWQWKAFPEPRPLYGLDELARHPDLPVLIVEGEKCADAAAALLPAMVVVTWPGGCKAIDKVDLAPLRGRVTTLWPDADDPGKEAMERIAARLDQACRIVRPNGHAEGWDIADAAAEGWDTAKVQAWARAHLEEWFPPPLPEVLEETHERVTDPEIERPPLVAEFIADEARPRFVFHAALDLVSEPTPTDWLLQGWFERNTLACYFGDPGSCKTWVALSQAVHIATGAPWHGQRVQQGAVFVLCGEGQRGFRRRLEGIRKHHEMSFEHVPLYVSEGPANLTDPDSVTDVLVAVQNLVEKTGAAPVLVVVDTLSRNFGAADENSTPDMAAFIGACDRIRQVYGSTILVVHHSGHGDKTRGRGNSALRAALDAEFKFTRDEAAPITATCTKAKDFEMPDARQYALANVPLDWPPGEDGLPINSAAVIEVHEQGEQPSSERKPVGTNQHAAMACITDLIYTRRRRLVADGRDPSGARVTVTEWQEASGLDRRRFYEVRKALEKAGLVNSDGFNVQINEG
jgi:hypothetical protein